MYLGHGWRSRIAINAKWRITCGDCYLLAMASVVFDCFTIRYIWRMSLVKGRIFEWYKRRCRRHASMPPMPTGAILLHKDVCPCRWLGFQLILRSQACVAVSFFNMLLCIGELKHGISIRVKLCQFNKYFVVVIFTYSLTVRCLATRASGRISRCSKYTPCISSSGTCEGSCVLAKELLRSGR